MFLSFFLFKMASLQLTMVLVTFFLQFLPGVYSSAFTIRNKCSCPVWTGILSGAGTRELSTTGFLLQPEESISLSLPTSWSGRLWGRTLCTQDSSIKFYCLTGDYGSPTMACSGGGAAPPATLAKFTLNGAGEIDFYDVCLVDPMMVIPQGRTGYAAHLNEDCPVELKIIDGSNERVACRSPCDAFRDPCDAFRDPYDAFRDLQYCCSGACKLPDTCKPGAFSEFFKNACAQAYSHANDDGTSTFTCINAVYIIAFCPDLSTRLNLITNAARPNPQGSSRYGSILIVRILILENTAGETKSCSYKKFPAKTEPFPVDTKPRSHVVHVLPRNRRLLGKLPDVNVHSPPSTSNEKSSNLDKEDPPSPPAPSASPPKHQ